jgi:23S rRNA (guanosine2251-2'-O)-methyltransferase
MRKLSHSEIKADRKDLTNINEFKRNPVYVLCDSIRSIFNVGAIFRASDGAFIEKIFLCGYTPYPPRKEIEKVALGATLSVPWEYVKDPVEVVKRLKADGIKICSLELTDKPKMVWDLKKEDFPLCLILGNEITGVAKELIDESDFSVELPMQGIKQSLNVSVATGIALYEMIRILNYS